jgi:histidinol phosphatase-like enzyme (inositol monophosphatase family)
VPWEKELAVAKAAAMHAGEVALGHQQRGLAPESKPDLTPVTAADKESERLITARLIEAFPEDGLLGEEGARRDSRSGRTWIVDPIDGTRDFIRGLPFWSVMIGLEADGEVVAGVVHFPAQKETYWAARGEAAWRNETRIRASKIADPAESVLCINSLNQLDDQPWAGNILPWIQQFWAVRSLGGCQDAVFVASGRAEIWVEPSAQPWDLAALKIILDESGARFVNFRGDSSIYKGGGVAFAPGLENVARQLLRQGL